MVKEQDHELSTSNKKALELLQKLIETSRPEAVFSKPVKIGDTQVITASEVQVGLGFGFGSSTDPVFVGNLEDDPGDDAPDGIESGGGGGGGGAAGRPVAVITITEDGVKVDPVFDMTKIALAFFTMLGSIFLFGSRIKRKSS